MDLEIASTLAELERKLHELERALTAIGRGEEAAADGAALARERTLGGGRLIDEATERERTVRVGDSARAPADSGARSAGGRASSGRAIGSARGWRPIERRQARDPAGRQRPRRRRTPGPRARRTPAPATPPDAAELLRFRERLDRRRAS